MTAQPRSALDLSGTLLDLPEQTIQWPALFGNDRPVELEIGSGKGLFLVNAAKRDPLRNFLGVEFANDYAHMAAARVVKNDLANVRVIRADARWLIRERVPRESLAAVHLYFPDPWWKKRHRRRRIFSDEFVNDLARVLIPGGDFQLATDLEEYFQEMTAILETHPEFLPQPTPVPKPPEHDLDYLTNFERKYRIEGRPIYRAHLRLAPNGETV